MSVGIGPFGPIDVLTPERATSGKSAGVKTCSDNVAASLASIVSSTITVSKPKFFSFLSHTNIRLKSVT